MKIRLDIDARDLLCPLPVLRLRKRLEGIAPGEVARLWSTDPAAHVDVPHFCAEAGHELLGVEEEDEATGFLVRKGASPQMTAQGKNTMAPGSQDSRTLEPDE